MAESKNSDESSNAVIVQIDVHHRPCSQLNASIATTNNVRVKEFQATSDLSSIPTVVIQKQMQSERKSMELE
ncbi:hypothetical protein TNCV_2881311 [Trichonephila clavipes]|nr:hypothetical protein TNCV_2881311 [Trichonephila clavipes]